MQQIIDSRKESEKIAILDIELENLRMIKDTFGYSAGEQIVIESAEILGNMLKNCCDIENSKKCYEIARSSEEGFVIVLSPMENTKQIEKCAKKVLGSFTHPVLTDTDIEALFVVVNIGISVYPDDGKNVETLLKNAILAGYEAANASDKIVFYSERLGKNIAENTLLTNKLYRSLSNKEFFLEFQPQFSFDEGKTAGVEALLRWNSGDNDRISPSRFVPILEQTGLIYDVGLWVLEQALQEHSRLVVKGFSPLRFSVNLSVVQFRREELIIDFAKIIERSGVDPKYIELEITESVFTENLEVLIEKLHKLKELGINIAIDDFGRGSSSLYRLNMIPFDRIKIDKDIIDSIDLARKRAPVVEMIISLARTFKASITAEGVETKEQMEFLRSAVCDEIQGNYYSKPLPAKALEEFLKEEQFGHRLQN